MCSVRSIWSACKRTSKDQFSVRKDTLTIFDRLQECSDVISTDSCADTSAAKSKVRAAGRATATWREDPARRTCGQPGDQKSYAVGTVRISCEDPADLRSARPSPGEHLRPRAAPEATVSEAPEDLASEHAGSRSSSSLSSKPVFVIVNEQQQPPKPRKAHRAPVIDRRES